MSRFSKCSLQRLRYYYTSTTSHSSHPTHFSPARLRNVWISGLLDPSKVTLTLREMLYSGHVDLMEDARKDIIKLDKEHESYIKQESWVSEVRALKKQPGSFTHLKWLINAPTADSITADLTFFNWRKHKMSIMDTTNCFDFTSEVKNALGAFDSAVLVLSSVDGVQDQSIAVDKQMITYQLPRLVFVNDLDQKGANPWQVLNQARSKLQHHCAAVQVPIGLEYNFKGLVDLVQLKAYFFHDSNGKKVVVEEVPTYMEALVSEKRHELIKTVSEVDGKLAEAFCIGKPISAADLKEAVRRATIARKFIPFLMGSAFKYKDTLVALAFTLKRKYDAITYLRIYDGAICKGEFITNVNTGKTFKVPHFFEAVQKDKMGVPHSIEAREDETKVPYTTEPRKDDLGAPCLFWVRNDEVFGVAHAGEIVAVHDVINAAGDTFTDGLVRYRKASVDVSELVSRVSGVQVSKV